MSATVGVEVRCNRTGCGWTSPHSAPSADNPAPPARIDLATFKADIANAFDFYLDHVHKLDYEGAKVQAGRAYATLAQLEVRERLLASALEACRTLDMAGRTMDLMEYALAMEQARAVLAMVGLPRK